MNEPARGCYRFDDFELDAQNLRLTFAGGICPLEPKSFRLLQFLIENRGRTVSKDEIVAAVWPETFVSDNSITRAVTQIRKALHDDAKEPKYIETVPTVGYRFVGDCREEQNPTASDASDRGHAHVVGSMSAAAPSRVRPYKWAAIAGAAAVVIGMAVGGWSFYSRNAHALTDRDTIVLADFTNSTGDSCVTRAVMPRLQVFALGSAANPGQVRISVVANAFRVPVVNGKKRLNQR